MQADLTSLLADHKWYVLAAVLLGFVMRLLKDDTKLPTIPKSYRPWLIFAAGVIALFVDKLAMGSTWQNALFNALIVGFGPIVGHDLLVNSLAGGKEVPLPNALMVEKDGPPKPPILPIILLCLASSSLGCIGSFEEAKLASGYKASADVAKQTRCDSIDNSQLIWGAATAILAGAAGANGVTAFKVQNEGTRDVLILVAGGAGLGALGTTFVWNHFQKKWVQEGCGA